jgi:hypothetical protein
MYFGLKYYRVLTKNRHASFSIVPRVMKKARSWRSLESSVRVLRLRKCDKIRNFHRKQVCAHPICKTKSLNFKNIQAKNHEKN